MIKDPYILFSFLNTKMRNTGFSLEEICKEEQMSVIEVNGILNEAGFFYDENERRFK